MSTVSWLICRYTHIILHAIGAAIPQSLVILHALLEVLPYPRHPRGVWYELFTGSVACTDEQEESVAPAAAGAGEASTIDGQGGDRVKSWLKDIGSVEAADTILKERIAVSHACPALTGCMPGARRLLSLHAG